MVHLLYRLYGVDALCVITKSAILISAQFDILPHYSFMVQNQFTVWLCLAINIDCWVLHTIVYCEAVGSAILATAWLIVNLYWYVYALYCFVHRHWGL